MLVPSGPVVLWSVQTMVQYMHAIDLGHLAPVIVDNGIDGRFLLQCSAEDLIHAGIGPLQVKKIVYALPGGAHLQPAVGGR